MRYDLIPAADGSPQWVELKDRADITRKELRATRVAFDAEGGMVEKMESHTETVLASCLLNWEVKARSGDPIPRPQLNIAEVRKIAGNIPIDTWFSIEHAINGEDGKGGYTRDCLEETKPDESGEGPSAALDRLKRAFEGQLLPTEHFPFPAYIDLALDDEKWLRRGLNPFAAALDDSPAERVKWLDAVMTLRERAQQTAAQAERADADYQQKMADREQRKKGLR